MIYAQLNDDDICVGVSNLSGVVVDSNLIQIEVYDVDLIGRRYDRQAEEWSMDKFPPFLEADNS